MREALPADVEAYSWPSRASLGRFDSFGVVELCIGQKRLKRASEGRISDEVVCALDHHRPVRNTAETDDVSPTRRGR